MGSGGRFVLPAIFAVVGFTVGQMAGSALVSAALGFLAALFWQHLQENRQRVDSLRRELEGLRGLILSQASEPRRTETPTQPPPSTPTPPAQEATPPPIALREEPPRPAPPSHPVEPARPGALDSAVTTIIRFFTTGNVIAKVGVVMLFLGVSFLVKYVGDQGWLPIEARLTAAAAGGIGLVGLGWRLRAKRAFGLVLQGGGVGIFYLTIFAAFRLYDLIPGGLAFGLLFATTLFAAILAVLQDAQALAIFGVSGGFLAPILTSTGSGSHVALFSYYGLLNAGIFAVGWFKSWRLLNVVGFAFTFVIGGAWGAKYYRPEHFHTVEPFLIAFFAQYVGIAYLFSRRDASIHGVDSGLLFGAPVVAFAMQAGLVSDTKYGLALSAVVLGAFYTLIARQVFRAGSHNRFVVQSYLGMGAAFLTLAVPLAFDGKWTAAIWAPEGAAVLWAGLRQRRKLVQFSGGALLLLAGASFVIAPDRPDTVLPFVNAFYVGYVVLALAYLSAGLSLYRDPQGRWGPVPAALAVVSAVWGLTGGAFELEAVAPAAWLRFSGEPALSWAARRTVALHAFVLYAVVAAVVYSAIGLRVGWRFVQDFRRGLLPGLTLLLVAVGLVSSTHPFADIGIVAWPVAFGVHYVLLHRAMHRHGAGFEAEQHFLPLYLGVALATWELMWQGSTALGAETWAVFAGALPLALASFTLSAYRGAAWPFGAFRHQYLSLGLLPLVGAMILYVLFLGPHAGDPRPLPYLPLLNPIDVASAGLLLSCAYWWMRASREDAARDTNPAQFWGILSGATFYWLTTAVVRSVHVYAAVPWTAERLLGSMVVHAALSVTWSLVALGTMVWATRSGRRKVWLVGSALLGVVALKLLVFDLSAQGTIERVVSFIATGALWLAVGYFAPLPPRKPDDPPRENSHV